MKPTIETLREKKLVGKKLSMSIAHNKTSELWKSFMPHRHLIENTTGTELFSLQHYPASYFNPFNPHNEFIKWAAVEVVNFEKVPEDMETLVIPAGTYAVFHYKGPVSEGAKVFGYIFGTWLPASGYVLDDRPHFEVLGEKYSNESPDSEEDIWIPVKVAH